MYKFQMQFMLIRCDYNLINKQNKLKQERRVLRSLLEFPVLECEQNVLIKYKTIFKVCKVVFAFCEYWYNCFNNLTFELFESEYQAFFLIFPN